MDENPLLQKVIDDAESAGYVYLTDQVTYTTISLALLFLFHYSFHSISVLSPLPPFPPPAFK